MVAETGARFYAPAHFDDELEITLEVERLGSTSMVSTIGVARDRATLAQGRIVHVFVRADRLSEKAPIPEHVRRILQRYSNEAPDSPATSPHPELTSGRRRSNSPFGAKRLSGASLPIRANSTNERPVRVGGLPATDLGTH